MKIAVAGLGYVGLSNAILLSRKMDVVAIDIDSERVSMVNRRICPIVDADMSQVFSTENLSLVATLDPELAYKEADFIIVATPTDYDEQTGEFDTSSVLDVIEAARVLSPEAVIVIKSTVPVGFTAEMRARFDTDKIIFSPEFLREGKALYDNLNPSRIVVGGSGEKSHIFAEMLRSAGERADAPILITGSNEAEAIKLFSNTYLAMRVSFFNELDSYAMHHSLDAKEIIDGVGLDPRIGTDYNNPSFGYGGYCLPKDTKQMLSNFSDTPQKMITATVLSNATRMDFIADKIAARGAKAVGIWRLVMKHDSDNFRHSSILGIMERLQRSGVTLLVYEPNLRGAAPFGSEIVSDVEEFKRRSDLIVANRMANDLRDVIDKVFTRDIYNVG